MQPKLLIALREGYDLARFRADALAGLTVAARCGKPGSVARHARGHPRSSPAS
jgi:hypothetical protein